MALLGKLLLVFNLLAAGGLIYVATQDWAKRQDLTATALQYRLVLTGLPLDAPDAPADAPDAIPFPAPTTGGQVVDTVRESLLKNYFKGADGGGQYGAAGDKPVATQLKEVKRVQAKVKAALGAASEADRLQMLAGRFDDAGQFAPGLLTRLAESFEEREFVRKLAEGGAADLPKSLERAEGVLNQKFDAVLATPDPKLAGALAERLKTAGEKLRAAAEPRQAAETRLIQAQAARNEAAVAEAAAGVKQAQAALDAAWAEYADVVSGAAPVAARDDADRRRRVAHLLVLLDRSADWQARAARVVGLKAYQVAVADQSARLAEAARSVQRQIESDQATFVDRYEQLRALATDRARLAAEQEVIRRLQVEQAVKDAEATAVRTNELAARTAVLAAVTADATAKLAAQTAVERQLFDVQKRAGETLRANFELEDALDKAEAAAVKAKAGGPRPN